MAFFSIIIPTFNSAANIATALESILHQTFIDFEVLIIDGFSADKTIEIAKSYSDDRIKIWSEKDKGIYDAMNKGIEKANGEWLYFLGSDDVLNDINVLYNVTQFIKLSDVDFVYGNVIMTPTREIYDDEFDIEKLCTKRNICHQAIFYKKNLFYKIGNYNLEYNVWADWDLNIRCFSNPLIKKLFFDKIICIYNNQSGHSTMSADSVFEKFLPVSYINKIAEYNNQIMLLQSQIKNIYKSKTFRLGNIILSPYRFINELFKSK